MTLRLSDKNADLAQKLIRMLSSDQDGEVVAAVRKLAGVLGRAGKSFHDLADQVQAGTDPAPSFEPTPPWHRPQQPWTPAELGRGRGRSRRKRRKPSRQSMPC